MGKILATCALLVLFQPANAQLSVHPVFAATASTTTTGIEAATLNWQAPTANVGGSTPLTPLSGYTIWRGTTATSLVKVNTVGPTVLTYQTAKLPAGTYFFAIEAVAADGMSSVMSNVVSITITAPATPGAPTSVTISATI